jgi:hypothetical protein
MTREAKSIRVGVFQREAEIVSRLLRKPASDWTYEQARRWSKVISRPRPELPETEPEPTYMMVCSAQMILRLVPKLTNKFSTRWCSDAQRGAFADTAVPLSLALTLNSIFQSRTGSSLAKRRRPKGLISDGESDEKVSPLDRAEK